MKVNEIFYSIQGEAAFTGTPSLFIRTQGCKVGCLWCDTKHTWPVNLKIKDSIENVINKVKDSKRWCDVSPEQLLAIAKKYIKSGHIVITGGEPLEQNIEQHVKILIKNGYSVQIETSGTEEISDFIKDNCWVTLSPKDFKKTYLLSNIKKASEIKLAIENKSDFYGFMSNFNDLSELKIWLQPVSEDADAIKYCIELCLEHGVRLSLQTHKMVDLR